MGSSRGKQQTTQAKTQADTAYREYTPSPLEIEQNNRILKFNRQRDNGTDIKDIDAVSPYYNLFEGAKRNQENSMVGTGALALAGDTNRSKDAGRLQQQMQSEKEQNAAGMLYNAYNQTDANLNNQGNFLIGVDQQRKSGRAGMAQQMYQTELHKPKNTPWWQTALGVGGQVGSAAIKRW